MRREPGVPHAAVRPWQMRRLVTPRQILHKGESAICESREELFRKRLLYLRLRKQYRNCRFQSQIGRTPRSPSSRRQNHIRRTYPSASIRHDPEPTDRNSASRNRGTVRQKKDGPGFLSGFWRSQPFSEDVKCDIAFLSPVFAAPDLCAWGRTCRLRWGILLCAEKIPRKDCQAPRERRGHAGQESTPRNRLPQIHKSPIIASLLNRTTGFGFLASRPGHITQDSVAECCDQVHPPNAPQPGWQLHCRSY